MKIKIITLALLFTGSVVNAHAQSSVLLNSDAGDVGQLLALNPGDKIPPVLLKGLTGNALSVDRLDEARKGKILILDFFATWCGSCIKALPHLAAVKNQFKNELLVLPVCYEKKETINAFLKRQPEIRNLGFTFLTGETVFSKLFPHTLIPHEIWIGSDGTFLAATSDEDINVENIKTVLKGLPLQVSQKKDDLTFDRSKMLNSEAGGDTSFLFRSLLTANKPGVGSGIQVKISDELKFSRIIATNCLISNLYATAFSNYGFVVMNRKRIFFEVRDSVKYFKPRDVSSAYQWGAENSFCYELVVPQLLTDTLFFSYMLEDLNRFFDVKGTVEPRLIDTWELFRISKDDRLLVSQGGEKSYPYEQGRIRNIPLSRLTGYMNRYYNIEEIIDKTGFKEPVDLDLPFIVQYPLDKTPDMQVVSEQLKKYGLDIRKVRQSRNVLVIKDKETSPGYTLRN